MPKFVVLVRFDAKIFQTVAFLQLHAKSACARAGLRVSIVLSALRLPISTEFLGPQAAGGECPKAIFLFVPMLDVSS